MTDHQLFEAVEGGDYEKVKQLLLSRRVDVNQAPRHQVIIFFSFLIIILSGDDVSLCVLSCDIDLKVLRKERDYSFDESMSKRRLKDDYFVD